MDFFQLHIFNSLVKTMNFSKTAEEMHITQPAVTYQIKKLEDELDIQLLLRDTHTTRLTAAGQEFSEYAAAICQQEFLARQRMKNISRGMTGRLTIASLQDHIPLLSEYLKKFFQKYPNIQLNTYILDGPDLSASYQNNEYDIYFGIADMLSPQTNYQTQNLGCYDMEFYCNKSIARQIDLSDPESLSDFIFLSIYGKNLNLYERVKHIMDSMDYHPKLINYYSIIDSILISINAGIGVSILPTRFVDKMLFPDILTFPIDHPLAKLTSVMAYRILDASNTVQLFCNII